MQNQLLYKTQMKSTPKQHSFDYYPKLCSMAYEYKYNTKYLKSL